MNKIRKIFCVLFRHSNIETCCFGYISCGRCSEQLGDTIAGAYKNPKTVGEFCGCDICKANYKKLTWIDKVLIPRKILANTKESLVVDRKKERDGFMKKLREQTLKKKGELIL